MLETLVINLYKHFRNSLQVLKQYCKKFLKHCVVIYQLKAKLLIPKH